MIPDKVKALFEFIDYLDNNKKEYIEVYIPLVNEALEVAKERSELDPRKNYKDKQKYDKVQKVIDEKFQKIKGEIVNDILEKLTTLKIWNGDAEFTSIYNDNIDEVGKLIDDFTDSDVKEIQEYSSKYLSFRTDTSTSFLALGFMFGNLDEVLKPLFDYFKDVDRNEFEPFEKKVIKAHSWNEAFEQLVKNKDVKVSLDFDTFHATETESLVPQQIGLSFEQLKELIEPVNPVNDFELLKKYIRENYLNVHPNNFTLERLEQIQRNISKWKLKLKDLDKAPKFQEFIQETILSLDLDIDRYKNNPPPERETTQAIYRAKVDSAAEPYISLFKKRYESSENKERLLKTEIDNYEKLFFPERLQLSGFPNNMDAPITGLPEFSSVDIFQIRELYRQIIVEGQRNYHVNFHNIMLEALVKYHGFLKTLLPHQSETKHENFKIDQIALIYFYEGKQITRENGNEIAKQYHHNSGEKLFQRYTYYSSTANRKAKPMPCTPKKLKNKIELFESIVPVLSGAAKQRAIDEIQILKTIFESEYQ